MKNLVSWFVDNPIAANLLMLFLLLGGLSGLSSIDKEMFPAFETDIIRVSVAYPGAGPREVEQQICIRIEESLEGLEGIAELRCVASLNAGTASIESASGYSFVQLLNAVKSRIDSINTFPQDTERPIVEEVRISQTVISVAVSGDADEKSIKEYAEALKDEISQLSEVPLVEIRGTRAYELAIEVPEIKLREFGLSLDSLAQIIASNSITVGGGLIETASGDIQIQVREQAYTGQDFANIPVITKADGTVTRLGDIANIIDGFVEDEQLVRFNGKPAAFLEVNVAENPDVLTTSAQVHEFIEERKANLPEGLELTIWEDRSEFFKARLGTLLNSGLIGLALVFMLLLLFLRPALAVWVSVGIAVAFIGTLFILPIIGVSINMITMFAFILVLGIVVDDAIIIGENIHRVQSRGNWGASGAKLGALEMSSPVFFAVATSVIVFVPMLFLPGDFAIFMVPMATIPIIALSFSLIESLYILPAHLSHLGQEKPSRLFNGLQSLRLKISGGLDRFLVTRYRPFLRYCLHHRGLTVAGFFSGFSLIVAIYVGGWVKTSQFPTVPIESVEVSATLPIASPFENVAEVAEHIESAAYRALANIEADTGEYILQDLYVLAQGNQVFSTAELVAADLRRVASGVFVREWESEVGAMPQAEDLSFRGEIRFGGSADIEFRLEGQSLEELSAASDWVMESLSIYEGVYNLRDTLNAGRPEMEISPTGLAATLGVTPALLAQQMRQIFYGDEIQRIPRFREDVRVMLRYPEEERSSTQLLDNLLIRTQDGREVAFNVLAQTHFVEGYSSITRLDGSASINVLADFYDDSSQTSEAVVNAFLADNLSSFQSIFPSVRISLDGAQLENREFMAKLLRYGFMAIMVIFGLLAIQFKSLLQPLIVITAIPFGFAGAVVGHLVTGQVMSLLSLLGVLAAAGVIVNDTLVLIDRANKLRDQGFSATHSIVQAGRDRFRPIFLTSATTFAGLTPLMLETSTQAQFLIPMATSLSFGVLAATLITLVMVPCVYSIAEEARARLKNALADLFA